MGKSHLSLDSEGRSGAHKIGGQMMGRALGKVPEFGEVYKESKLFRLSALENRFIVFVQNLKNFHELTQWCPAGPAAGLPESLLTRIRALLRMANAPKIG